MPDNLRRRLRVLDAEIEACVESITGSHPWWPCARGCDACCRSLGDLPYATLEEWTRVGEALAALDDAARAEVHARIEALARTPDVTPVQCPMLDASEGACRVYEARPLACRSYGFYVSRGDGRWCDLIERELGARPEECERVVFGNLDALDTAVRAGIGEKLTLTDWWRDYGASKSTQR